MSLSVKVMVSALLASALPAAAEITFLKLDGVQVAGEEGSGAVNGFDARPAFVGSGVWASGLLGFSLPSGQELRVGFGYADMKPGIGNGGGGVNEYGIDDAKMTTIDLEWLGREMALGGSAMVRPLVGLRSLSWSQDHGFRPDAPLGCCFMNTDFSGVGPRVGVELKAPLGGKLSFSGGLDASYLIGTMDFEKSASSGSEDRKVASVGGFAGIDYAISANATVGIQYKYMQLNGASVDDQEFIGPSVGGNAENVMQGFGVSFQMNF